MATNNGILMLRSWSLRWILVLFILISIIVSVYCVNSDSSLGMMAVLAALGGMLLYAVLTVRAVEDDNKATMTAYIFILAYFISFIGSFANLKDSPGIMELGYMGLSDSILGGTSLDDWTMQTLSSALPYTIIMNLMIIGGLLYALQSVRKKFVSVWWAALVTHAISGIGGLLWLVTDNYQTFQTFNNIGCFTGFVFFAMLFVVGGRERTAQSPAFIPVSPVAEQPAHSGIVDKGQELLKLKELLDAGILTQEEFDKEKSNILNQ